MGNAPDSAHPAARVKPVSAGKNEPTIDEIDAVLARHYGFTAEEQDFIIHYDIKYRLGRDGGDEE